MSKKFRECDDDGDDDEENYLCTAFQQQKIKK